MIPQNPFPMMNKYLCVIYINHESFQWHLLQSHFVLTQSPVVNVYFCQTNYIIAVNIRSSVLYNNGEKTVISN